MGRPALASQGPRGHRRPHHHPRGGPGIDVLVHPRRQSGPRGGGELPTDRRRRHDAREQHPVGSSRRRGLPAHGRPVVPEVLRPGRGIGPGPPRPARGADPVDSGETDLGPRHPARHPRARLGAAPAEPAAALPGTLGAGAHPVAFGPGGNGQAPGRHLARCRARRGRSSPASSRTSTRRVSCCPRSPSRRWCWPWREA